MRLRFVLSAAGITAASLLSSPTAPAAAPTAPSAPGTPTIARGHGQITVTWSAPASTGGSPITAYRVRVEPGHRTVAVAAPATSATVTGLADGTSVTATVEALNAAGTSPAAAAGSAIPTPPISSGTALPGANDAVEAVASAPDGTTYVATDSKIFELAADGTATALPVGTVNPSDITVAPDGAVLWIDEAAAGHGYLVRRFDDGTVTTVAGGGDPTPGYVPPAAPVLATDALLVSPLALDVSPVDGSVFLVDVLCGVVERFTIGGNLAVVAGDATPSTSCMGHGDSDGDGGAAVDAHLDNAQGVTVDDTGAVYVSETSRHRVRRFTVGGTIQTVAGDGTTTIDPGPDLDATATGVPYPARMEWIPGRGLLIDASGRKRLLVGDRLQRIGDDAFDRAIFNAQLPPGDGMIGANDNTLSMAWDGDTLWGVYVVHEEDGWVRELRSIGPWLPAEAPTAHPGFGSWTDLVTLHYRAFVNRPPTTQERTTWVTQLTDGTKTPGQFDDALRTSTENLTNVDPVVRLYRAFLGRAPDASGLRYWIGKKRAVAPAKTWSVTQLANQFTASSEFQRKYGSLSNQAFVTRIYTDVLGRAADPSGVTFWTKQLDTKRRTRATVMVGFSESPEYQRKQAANTDVAIAYLSLVGRMPTSEETATWTNAVIGGATDADLLDQLVIAAPGLLAT